MNRVVVLPLLAHVAVGTHGKTVQWHSALLGPVRQGLRQQRQAGHQEQNALTRTGVGVGVGFGNFQAGERLARTASHDELASALALKTRQGGSQRALLMRPHRFLGLENRGLFGVVLRPLDLAAFQVAQVNLTAERLLVDQRILGVGAPVVGGADNQAVGEWLLSRRREKLSMSAFCNR